MWVGLKPIDGTSVDVTVETDRKNTFRERIISSSKAKIPGQPFMVKTKLKAKKKYDVRVRTYKTVSGKKYYSTWSKAKYVTTKN